MMQKTNNKHNS